MVQVKNSNLENALKKAIEKKISLVRSAPEDSDFAKANAHLLTFENTQNSGFGIGAGELTMGGFFYYKLTCILAVTGSTTGTVHFNASGVGFDAGGFTSQVAGTFLVNPKDIAGNCYFTLEVADVVEGGVTFTLYSEKHGTVYGVFIGDTEGLDAAAVAGKGHLKVSGF